MLSVMLLAVITLQSAFRENLHPAVEEDRKEERGDKSLLIKPLLKHFYFKRELLSKI